MSVLIAYDTMYTGINMSGTTTGGGFILNDSSVSSTYLGAYDWDTVLYSVSGAGLVKYFAVSGTVNLYTGNAKITELIYADYNGNPLLAWTNINLSANLYDNFSYGINYTILNTTDYIYGNKYADIIKAGSGNDYVYGNAGNDTLYGESGNDFIKGGIGNDTLKGGFGNDMLYGETGADRFIFDSALSVGSTDTIKDFQRGIDKLVLDDDVFTKMVGKKAIGTGNFIRGTRAVQSDDYFIYNTQNDMLYYDADGSGSRHSMMEIAKIELSGSLSPTYTDFVVVA
jgi:Ca2+-binding RTX toxin-like protein